MNPVIPSQAGRPFPVPIRVVGEPDTTIPEQFATFFFLDASGEIAKIVQTVPIQNGVALYTAEPLPQGARWAITVHDAAGLTHFRSGPLHRLPGTFLPIAFGTRISAFRASARSAWIRRMACPASCASGSRNCPPRSGWKTCNSRPTTPGTKWSSLRANCGGSSSSE